MNINIDANSGFCFGVVYAIQMAEDELEENGKLYCLGDIVHNNMEVDRLKAKGLEIINHEQVARARLHKSSKENLNDEIWRALEFYDMHRC